MNTFTKKCFHTMLAGTVTLGSGSLLTACQGLVPLLNSEAARTQLGAIGKIKESPNSTSKANPQDVLFAWHSSFAWDRTAPLNTEMAKLETLMSSVVTQGLMTTLASTPGSGAETSLVAWENVSSLVAWDNQAFHTPVSTANTGSASTARMSANEAAAIGALKTGGSTSIINTGPMGFSIQATVDQVNSILNSVPRGTYPLNYSGPTGYKIDIANVKRNEPADKTWLGFSGGSLDTLNMQFLGAKAVKQTLDNGQSYNLLVGKIDNANDPDGIKMWGKPPMNSTRLTDIQKWIADHPEQVAALQQIAAKASQTTATLVNKYGTPEQQAQLAQAQQTVAKLKEVAAAAQQLKNEGQSLEAQIKAAAAANANGELATNLKQVKAYMDGTAQLTPEQQALLDMLFPANSKKYSEVGFGTSENDASKVSYEVAVTNKQKGQGSLKLDLLVKSLKMDFPFDPDVHESTNMVASIEANCTQMTVHTSGQIVLLFPTAYGNETAVRRAVQALNLAWGEASGKDTQPFGYIRNAQGTYQISYTYYFDVTQTFAYNQLVNQMLTSLGVLEEGQTVEPMLPCGTAPTVVPTPAPTTVPVEMPAPVSSPVIAPTATPTAAPTAVPTAAPTATPTAAPTATPTATPTAVPTAAPTAAPTATPTAAPTATPTPAPTTTSVTIDTGFAPGSVSIKVGDSVKWINQNTLQRTLRSEQGLFGDQNLSGNGGTFTFTFTNPGTFTVKTGAGFVSSMTVTVTN